MVIIHAVQKLLSTSRIEPVLYVSEPAAGQLMHSWYARLLTSGFAGKFFVIYVHDPSLLTVVCRGRTIKSTWTEFLSRLPLLMRRFDFPTALIKQEMKEADGYVVGKTNSKSILAHMNQMIIQLESACMRFDTWEDISQDYLEDQMMGNFYKSGSSRHYTTPNDFWKERF